MFVFDTPKYEQKTLEYNRLYAPVTKHSEIYLPVLFDHPLFDFADDFCLKNQCAG
jgi:hypothetical protein